jgi:hypothetical protein
MRIKKILVTISFVILLGFLINFIAFGQEKTATSSSEKEVEILKEKIASKVAELRQENNQAFSGKIVNLSENQIEIKDKDDKKVLIKLDPTLTKYYRIKNNQKKEINFSDLEKNDYIVVSGITTDKGVNANLIFVDEKYLVEFGRVIEINKDSYWLKINTLTNENIVIDIETYTKQWLLNIKSLELEKTGFSKIKEGDIINFVAKDEKNESDHFSAQKIIVIPQEYFLK